MALIIKQTGFDDFLDRSGGSWVKALILGNPDVGKTRSASFWPKPIFADCEDGRMSIADRKVPYARVRSVADMDALLEELRKDSMRAPEHRKYLTFVVDTLDSYQRIIIQERLKAEKKEALSGWADWGYLDGKMQQFVEKLLNLNMNIVVNLHVKEETVGEDDSKMLVKKPRLKGDIKESVLQEFDLIGHMETSYKAEKGQRTRTRQIRWHNEPAYPFLKDRSGRLPRFTEIDFTEDDYNRIFEAITAGVDELPESQELDRLEVAEEVQPADPDEKGGPVEVGKLPAKKATAKKAAAKKAAETKAQNTRAQGGKATVTEKRAEPKGEEPKSPVTNGRGTAEEPVELPADVTTEQAEGTFIENLDHVHSADGTCLKNRFGSQCGAEPSTDVEKSTNATPERKSEQEQKAEDDAATAAAVDTAKEQLGAEVTAVEDTPKPEKYCGLQPESYKKFTDAPEGCGKDLAGENTAKVNLSLLRAHAMLCADCMDAWKSSKSA